MKIYQLLFGRKPLNRKMFSGKNRLPRKVSLYFMQRTVGDLTREEENLFYLRQPYVTKEQEDRFVELYIKPKENEQPVFRRIPDNVTAVDRLKHLLHKSSWE